MCDQTLFENMDSTLCLSFGKAVGVTPTTLTVPGMHYQPAVRHGNTPDMAGDQRLCRCDARSMFS